MMPKPPRQPKPLKRLSAQAMGPNFTASKKRNSTNAASWPPKPAGVTSQRTSQKATTSSQTMLPGSATPMFFAVTVLAHQPASAAAAISRPICAVPSQGASALKASQAHKVPAVPGASGLSPAPKPSASRCAGCASMKRALGRRAAAGVAVARRATGGRSLGKGGIGVEK